MDTVNIPREDLEKLLERNEQMKADLKQILNAANKLFPHIKGITATNAMMKIPGLLKVGAQLMKDPEISELFKEENLTRLNQLYGD